MAQINKSFMIRSFVIIYFLLLFCSCKSWNVSTPQIKENQMLFEVINEPFGPIYPPSKTLTLRVFDNKEIEFDYYLSYGPNRVGIPFTSELRKSSLTDEQMQIVKNILDEIESEPLQNNYSPTQRIFDCSIKVTLNYQSKTKLKQTIINENDSRLHLEMANSYPKPLIELLRFAQEVNWEKLQQFRKESGK